MGCRRRPERGDSSHAGTPSTPGALRAEGSAQIRFSNLDVGVPHNVAIYDRDDSDGAPLFRGEMIVGSSTAEYLFDAPLRACSRSDVTHTPTRWSARCWCSGAAGAATNANWFARTAERVATASHGSALAAETTGQNLVAPWQIATNYVFSLISIVLVLLLLRARPRDWTARFLALGMVGTAAVFNSQAHVAFHVLPGVATDAAHQAFHMVSGVSYMVGLLLFPDGHLVPRFSKPSWYRGAVRAAGAVRLRRRSACSSPPRSTGPMPPGTWPSSA